MFGFIMLDVSSESCPSVERNNEYDQMLSLKTINALRPFVVGKQNKDGSENLDAQNIDYKDPQFSPLYVVYLLQSHMSVYRYIYMCRYGDWTGICPLYMTVGGQEILLDDAINAADAAFQANVDVQLDIEPYLCHVTSTMVAILPDGMDGNVRGADFFLKHMT